MKKQSIKLVKLLTEIGDLKNIPAYPYKINNDIASFETNLGDQVKVTMEEWPEGYLSLPASLDKPGKANILYNFSYEVNQTDEQAKKTNFSYLIKILKTVTEIVSQMIIESDKKASKDKNPIYTIFASSKLGAMYIDKQKILLYGSIAQNNMLPGYKTLDVQFQWRNGFAITKIK